MLGRALDPGGLAFWTGSLDRAEFSRGQILANIAESPENKAGTAPLVQAGIWDRSEAAAQVARLYDTGFGRLPDLGGLTFWTRAIEGARATLDGLAQAFVTSAEFVATYGALANRAFVEQVYVNTPDRVGDPAGVDFWTGTLDLGGPRATVALGFSESLEHRVLTALDTGGETPDTFGVRTG